MLKEKWIAILQNILEKTEKNLDVFVSKYPHVGIKNQYCPEENALWTSSFLIGMAYLAYDVTGDKSYIRHRLEYLESFENRLQKRIGISHDLGFLYTLTAAADYKLTGDERSGRLAGKAADMLAERYNEKGRYIQAWHEIGAGYPDANIIIDTMMNLPLLYGSGNPAYFDMARNHAMTAAHTLVRKDYSTFHGYLVRPETGEMVKGVTYQGYADNSTWARGQAWAVYGYALSYAYTGEQRFLQVARETEKVFRRNLPRDYVPYWDFHFTDENPDIRDTSAAAVYCCGLLELAKYAEPKEAEEYREIVYAVMTSLQEHYTLGKSYNGILAAGMYHRDHGADECVIWGDYFYMEAAVRLLKDWNMFW